MSKFDSETGMNYGLMVLIAIFAAVVSSFVTYKAVTRNSARIAVVDLQRVVAASKDVAALRAERDAQIQDLQKMTEEANAKINAESNEQAKQKLSEQYLSEINGKKEGYDRVYVSAVQASDQKLSDVISSVAEKEGLNVVLTKAYVVTGGKDITDSVIDMLK